jgi:hypothetical protein
VSHASRSVGRSAGVESYASTHMVSSYSGRGKVTETAGERARAGDVIVVM